MLESGLVARLSTAFGEGRRFSASVSVRIRFAVIVGDLLSSGRSRNHVCGCSGNRDLFCPDARVCDAVGGAEACIFRRA